MKLCHDDPWLIADLGAPLRVLSWSLTHPGFATARRVAFRQVRDADLPEGRDVGGWLAAETRAAGLGDAPVLLTSRRLGAYRLCHARAEETEAACLATVGLSNAERAGHRRALPAPAPGRGTINLLVRVSDGLSEAAQIEALSIAAEARTAAVMETGPLLPAGRATGTGTDCIALAAPAGGAAYAGLHTAIGEAVGRAVYDAVLAGAREWMAARPDLAPGARS
ncbi:adenosylcobinamide amidohydrolase [Poseidonocella sp. HB161398]|uniref:adenosylcobinamide amidohydrolase n=1 Tax=Poseidonocella sp. HB161398 TaxID=2320855 RepID=UPI0011097BEA|nr:adenosylcobinamide amidohydrolase [Poseidonocella sp. HB161398]